MKLKKFNEYKIYDDEEEDPNRRYTERSPIKEDSAEEITAFLKKVDSEDENLFDIVKVHLSLKGLKDAIKYYNEAKPGPYTQFRQSGGFADVTQTQAPKESTYKDITPEELDKLNIVELVEKFADKKLLSRCYHGENKMGFIPSYIEERLRTETTKLPNSTHSHGTWDTYYLLKPKIYSEKVVHYINYRTDRGHEYSVNMCWAQKKVQIEYFSSYDPPVDLNANDGSVESGSEFFEK